MVTHSQQSHFSETATLHLGEHPRWRVPSIPFILANSRGWTGTTGSYPGRNPAFGSLPRPAPIQVHSVYTYHSIAPSWGGGWERLYRGLSLLFLPTCSIGLLLPSRFRPADRLLPAGPRLVALRSTSLIPSKVFLLAGPGADFFISYARISPAGSLIRVHLYICPARKDECRVST